MGLTVFFLKFCLKCIDSLAWPSFALGYPLYASIRAIETNSKHHMKKLITYWIIFNMISLFELGFAKLFEWFSLWPYVKLLAICLLVMPRFNGACYVYQNFIQPSLHMNLKAVIGHLPKPYVQIYFNKDPFAVEVERYVKETASNALDKLDDRESRDAKENLYEENCKTIPAFVKKEMVTTTQVKPNVLDLPQTKMQTFISAEIKKPLTSPIGADGKLTEMSASMKLQDEWTCAVCKLTTSSEKNLNEHIQGKKHKTECDKLKASKQTTENTSGSSTVINRSNQGNLNSENGEKNALAEVITFSPREVKEPETQPIGGEWKLPEIPAFVNVQKEWTCAVCQVKTTSEKTLNNHLRGKKHRANCEKLKASKHTAKNTNSSSPTVNNSHHRNKDMENGAPKDGSNCSKKKKQKEKVQLNVETSKQSQKKEVHNFNNSVNQSQLLWCSFCNVMCLSEVDLAAHLNGTMHLSRLQQMMNL